jgi:hypothetical protein
METTCSLSEPRTTLNIRKQKRKLRESTLSLANAIPENTAVGLDLPSGEGLFLVYVRRFEWVLSTVPIRLRV